jgi:hypothetical protein
MSMGIGIDMSICMGMDVSIRQMMMGEPANPAGLGIQPAGRSARNTIAVSASTIADR